MYCSRLSAVPSGSSALSFLIQLVMSADLLDFGAEFCNGLLLSGWNVRDGVGGIEVVFDFLLGGEAVVDVVGRFLGVRAIEEVLD